MAKMWWGAQKAAEYSGLPVQMIRCKMRAHEEGRAPDFDIGIAMKAEHGKKWSFYIFPEKFKAWCRERGIGGKENMVDDE